MQVRFLEAVDFTVDRRDDLPLATQVAWKLKALIVTGYLPTGLRLPSVRELALLADVNVNTARAVYRRLEDEGVITSERGRGTFVASGAATEALAEVATEAAARARDAGLDPREVAAALYGGVDVGPRTARPAPEPVPERRGAGTDRRELKREIAALEAELARLEPLSGSGAAPRQAGAGRILSTEELASVRDELAGRVTALRRAGTAFREYAVQAREEARRTREEEERRRGTWAHSGASTGMRARPARIAWTHGW